MHMVAIKQTQQQGSVVVSIMLMCPLMAVMS